jgi:cadmium resistance protein CadD (predicted permease)
MKHLYSKKLSSAMPFIGFMLVVTSFLLKYYGVSYITTEFISGIGCAWVGIGIIGIIIKRLKPEITKKIEIDQKDERNMRIRDKSGYISFIITLFSFIVLEFIFLTLENN